MMAVKVSVIVPVYNVELYLEECLQSIVDQTCKDIEIIIVNDGSTDSSVKIIEKYKKKDSRIIIINQQNKGSSGARNAGIDIARGEYILFVDSDDFLREDCIELLYQRAERELDIILYGAEIFTNDPTNEIYIREMGNRIWDRDTSLNEVLQGVELFKRMVLCKKFMASIPIQFFKRNLIVDYQIRFSEGYICEDFAFAFATIINANKVMCIKDKLYYRRIRPNSVCTTSQKLNAFLGRFVAYVDVVGSMPDVVDDKETYLIFIRYADQMLHNAVVAYRQLSDLEKEQVSFGENIKYEIFFRGVMSNLISKEIPNYNLDDKEKQIVVFGAGLIGEQLINTVGMNQVVAFIDNFKQGSYCGKPIINLQEYINQYSDYNIVIATRYYKEIAEQLRKCGIKKISKYIV